MVTTNEFIQQEHMIAQRFNSMLSEYNQKKAQLEQMLKEKKEKALVDQKNGESWAQNQLAGVTKVREFVDNSVGDFGKKLQSGANMMSYPAIQGLSYSQQISTCLSIAEEARTTITAFIRKGTTVATLNRHGAGCIFPSVGILLPILLMLATQTWYNWFIWLPAFMLIGGLIQLATYKLQWTAPKRAYKKLEKAVQTAENCHQQQLYFIRELAQRQLKDIEAKYAVEKHQLDKWRDTKLNELQYAFSNFTSDVHQLGLLGKEWNDQQWGDWRPTVQAFPMARLGAFSAYPIQFSIPALIPCPGGGNVLIGARGEARQTAVLTIQSIMLRMLATQVPSKLQFTLIDPVGLGQNVAAFMRLADFDEALVSSKAWTEPRHIEAQLLNISEHMETVIQKYLRNQYLTIEEYNQQAGEIAEPYRVLVVIGFPNNFNEDTARRLLSIATNGPKCGVSTLVLLDEEAPPIYNFNLEDLKRVSSVISWNGTRFAWQHSDFDNFQLTLDSPPSLEWYEYILEKVGEAAKTASKIEVPFRKIARPITNWWTDNSQAGLSVPLGPRGVNQHQYLELGEGTSQHVLVVGKTGSGKTNLLHVIIVGLATAYSPDELELYLVDFKTVGFTAYATYELPHARVVAIQSEREFGLSVVKGLDDELERRKNLLSKAGVKDIVQYRKNLPQERLPRILLLVDEFQEFFTYDDNLAQQASLCLDRLVRQGRAFGMHVMLGSQTLSGSYVLPRSTISQMAVRIVLQCEEADSRLALSDDNAGARLLSRTGEAIYNAKNGIVGSNNIFQGFLLSEEELERYLIQLQQLAKQRNQVTPWKQIVFDGSKNARITDNALLTNVLSRPASSSSLRSVPVWLGDPIAIKEPTAVQIRPQAGSNLLVIGQQEDAAQGIFITALISLAAQYQAGGAFIVLCDLMSGVDSPNAGLLERLGQSIGGTVQVVQRRSLSSVISHLSSEVERRMEISLSDLPTIYLMIYGLQRARDLRPEDSLSFSSFGMADGAAQPNPAKQFATILREGPELKTHTLVWCDTLNNLNRTLERGMLREFEMRVVFQMSSEDSMTLIDAPAASTVGLHRALLFSEETGHMEKFRPYGIPQVPHEIQQWNTWIQNAVRCIYQKQAAQPIG